MNICAKVLYRDTSGQHKLAWLDGERFDETDPTKWGLEVGCRILLVMQGSQYLNAWVCGERQDRQG